MALNIKFPDESIIDSDQENLIGSHEDLVSALNSPWGDKIFTLGVMIWSLHDFFQFSEMNKMFDPVVNYFRFAGLGLILISIFTRRFFKLPALQTMILGIVLIFLMVNNSMLAGDFFWMDLLIIILGSLGINYSRFFFSISIYRIVLNLGLIIFALLGKIPNNVTVVGTVDGMRVRSSLGYTWVSFAAHTLLFITLLLIWKFKDKMPLWLLLVLVASNIWVYKETDTKSPFILVILALALCFLFSKIRQKRITSVLVRLGIVFLFPFLFLLMYYLSLHSSQFSQLNEILSGRLVLGHTYISQYGLTKFGHPIYESSSFNSIGQTYQILDSSMMRYIIKYGVVSTIIFNIAWCFTSWRVTSIGNIYYDIILVVLTLEAFGDPWFLYPSYNIFLVLLGIIIFNHEELLKVMS